MRLRPVLVQHMAFIRINRFWILKDYRKGIECGLRKINYYSYMAKAGTQAVIDKLQEGNVLFFHDLALAAQKAMEEDVEKALRVFARL